MSFVATERIDGVLFDFDGTLVDSRDKVLNAFSRFAIGHGIAATEAVISLFDGLTTYEILEKAKADWGVTLSCSEMKKAYFALLRVAYEQVSESSEATPTLAALSTMGKKLGLVTSAPEELVEPVLGRLGWSNLFHCKIFGSRGIRGKPDPLLYLTALSKLRINPQNVLAVEDSVVGVRSAVAAKIRVIAIGCTPDHSRFRHAGANLVADNLSFLVSAVR
jgi:beta-phosphoglucomutase